MMVAVMVVVTNLGSGFGGLKRRRVGLVVVWLGFVGFFGFCGGWILWVNGGVATLVVICVLVFG